MYQNRGRYGQDRYGGGGGGGGGWRGQGGGGGGGGGGEEVSTMVIPSRDVGKVIGKGGSKIRELREESGAYINFRREEETDDEAVIELKGSPEAIDHAKSLIEDFLARFQRY